MIIEQCSPQQLQAIWPTFRHRAKQACERVGHSKWEDLELKTLEGPYVTWAVIADEGIYAIVTLARVDYACEIVHCVGKGIHRFLPLLKTLEQFARDNELHTMRIFGRKGWQRILKDYKVMEVHSNYLVLERPL